MKSDHQPPANQSKQSIHPRKNDANQTLTNLNSKPNNQWKPNSKPKQTEQNQTLNQTRVQTKLIQAKPAKDQINLNPNPNVLSVVVIWWCISKTELKIELNWIKPKQSAPNQTLT